MTDENVQITPMLSVTYEQIASYAAEIERLRAELGDARTAVAYNVDRATRAESELAALRGRIAEAPVVEWSREDWLDHYMECSPSYIGKRVRLVVDEG